MGRPIGQWDATAGWASPYTNGANDRPIHQSGDHNNILILLFHTELWNKPNKYGGPNQKSCPPSYLGRVHMKRYAVINLAYAKPMQRIGRVFFTTTAG